MLGLAGMRERAALVGGSLLVESQPGQGTLVIFRVPWRYPWGTRHDQGAVGR
jgi:signal transduction histidine kinase